MEKKEMISNKLKGILIAISIIIFILFTIKIFGNPQHLS